MFVKSLTSDRNPHQDDGLECHKDTKDEEHVQGYFPQSISKVRSADGRLDDPCDADCNCRGQHDAENRTPSCHARNRIIREGCIGKQAAEK